LPVLIEARYVENELESLVEKELENHNGETLSVAIINDANLWFEHLILLGKSTSLPPQTLS